MEIESKKKTVIVFDLDGTLFQTDKVWVSAIQQAQQELGMEITDTRTIISHFNVPPRQVVTLLACGTDDDLIEKLFTRIMEIGTPLIPERGRLYPGIREMLQELYAMGFKLRVCTNASLEYAETILSTFNISGFFTGVASAEDNRGDKKELVKKFLEPHGTAVMVGDRSHDFQAAQAVRIPSIGASYGYGGEELSQADYVADSAPEILTYLKRIDIFARIESGINTIHALQSNKPLVLGVNGVDTSGKTMFSRELEIYLRSRGRRTQLVHLDDFHNLRGVRSQGSDPIQSYFDNAFNLELLTAQILEPARRGEVLDIELKLTDLESDTLTNFQHYHIDPDTVIILEGVLLYRPPLDRFFDYRVFLQVSFDEVLRRAELRDVPRFGKDFLARYREKYIPIQKRYLTQHTPRQRSDMVIDNTRFTDPRIIT